MLSIDLLLLVAGVSVVLALAVLIMKLNGRLKLGWPWLLALVATILTAGYGALWVAYQMSASV
jgi:hypothetical protein